MARERLAKRGDIHQTIKGCAGGVALLSSLTGTIITLDARVLVER